MDTIKLRTSTKHLVAIAIAAGTLFEVPPVHDALIALEQSHPHWTGAIATMLAIASLLHNPLVQEAIGVDVKVEASGDRWARLRSIAQRW